MEDEVGISFDTVSTVISIYLFVVVLLHKILFCDKKLKRSSNIPLSFVELTEYTGTKYFFLKMDSTKKGKSNKNAQKYKTKKKKLIIRRRPNCALLRLPPIK